MDMDCLHTRQFSIVQEHGYTDTHSTWHRKRHTKWNGSEWEKSNVLRACEEIVIFPREVTIIYDFGNNDDTLKCSATDILCTLVLYSVRTANTYVVVDCLTMSMIRMYGYRLWALGHTSTLFTCSIDSCVIIKLLYVRTPVATGHCRSFPISLSDRFTIHSYFVQFRMDTNFSFVTIRYCY